MVELTKEQREIKQAAREFAEGEFGDIANECDEHETFPIDMWKRACEYGFIGAFIGEPYGGAGLGILECALIMEEFWRIDPGCGNILLSTLGAEVIHDYGNEEQKTKYLPPLTKAESIIGTVPSEKYIENAFRYYKFSDDQFALNGSSEFVVNGTNCDHLIILAESEEMGDIGKRRSSTFIIDKNGTGIKAAVFSDKLGVRATDICQVMLDNVAVPSQNLVGIEGNGLIQFDAFMDRLSIYNTAQAIGASQGCLDRAIKYSRQRVQFGHPIGWFQMVQLKIVEMATRIEAARNLFYKAAEQFDQGKKDRRLISMANWLAREAAEVSTSETLQIHGGYGYVKDLDIERFYRDARFLELFGVSSQREKLRVAEKLLGKMR